MNNMFSYFTEPTPITTPVLLKFLKTQLGMLLQNYSHPKKTPHLNREITCRAKQNKNKKDDTKN